MLPIPVDRFLVPAAPALPPPDANLVEIPVSAGLPVAVPMDGDTSLIVTLTTGLGTEWRAVVSIAPVTGSSSETEPRVSSPPDIGGVNAARLTLALERGGRTLAAVPLVVGRHRLVEPGDTGARRYDVWILEWDVRAGNVRGPGDFGSRLRLAWRAADRAIPSFSPLPIASAVVRRTPPPPPPPPPPATGPGTVRIDLADLVRLKKGRFVR